MIIFFLIIILRDNTDDFPRNTQNTTIIQQVSEDYTAALVLLFKEGR